jgi:hypothetical protein
MNRRPQEKARCHQLMAHALRRHGFSSLDTLEKVAFQRDNTLANHPNDSEVRTKECRFRSQWMVTFEVRVKCSFPNLDGAK